MILRYLLTLVVGILTQHSGYQAEKRRFPTYGRDQENEEAKIFITFLGSNKG